MHLISALLYLCDNVQMESTRIADQLLRSIHGEAWHGPSVLELLEDVTWQQAAARPIPAAHTIWELVLHITAWSNIGRRRTEGEKVVPLEPEDWPDVGETNQERWTAAIDALVQSQTKLAELIGKLTPERLD